MFLLSIINIIVVLIALSCTYYIFCKYKNNEKIFIALMIVPIVFGLLSVFITYFSHYFNEVRNYKIVKIKHQEKYSKLVVYTVQVACGTDKKGHTKYRTEVRRRTDYIGPFWIKYSSSGNMFNITKDEYLHWKNIWKNEKHTGTVRGTSAGLIALDGKTFECYYNGKFDDIYPAPEIHLYLNKIRNSNSVFGYMSTNNHPVDKKITTGALGNICLMNYDFQNKLDKFNSEFGEDKQVHIIFYVSNSLNDDSLKIINNWGGLNKNELAIFVGIQNKKFIWTNCHSWMKNTECQDYIRDNLIIMKNIDTDKILNVIQNGLKKWHRREFSDFDYLPMTINNWSWIIIVINVIIVTVTNIIYFNVSKSNIKHIKYDYFRLK